jgi:tetratricopeptide (TPR) repeat protein
LGYAALGQLYLSNKHFQQAEDILREGLKRQTNNNVLHLQLAMALELSGQYDAAIAEYETMFAADPRSTIVANNLASLLSDHRDDPASLDRAFTIASRLKGSDVPQFLDTLGWIYSLKGEYDQALPLVKTAAENVPESGTYQYHLGITYKGLGQKERAIASLKKAVELLPTDSDKSVKARAALDQLAATDSAPDATKSN